MERYKLRLDELLEESGYSHTWAAITCGLSENEIKAACNKNRDLPGVTIYLLCKALRRDINEFYHIDDNL